MTPPTPLTPLPAVPATSGSSALPARRSPLAELVVRSGLLTEEQMAEALALQAETGVPLARVLRDHDLVSEAELVRLVSAEVGMPYVDLNHYPVDRSVTQAIPESLARRHHVLAIGREGRSLVVAVSNPGDVVAMDDLRSLPSSREMQIVLAPRSQIDDYIGRLYRFDQEASAAARTAASMTDEEEADLSSFVSATGDQPIAKFVNLTVAQAVNMRASDIHVEPGADELRIRYRIDGVLHETMRAPKSIRNSVISRIKVLAGINIAERRIPQDGRITTTVNGVDVDLRVATLPIVHGEKVVMRILDKSNAVQDLTSLGFLPDTLSRYERSYRKAYGTILVTGPTGSGKSTTLYATLHLLNSPERNLIAVEDPVEYQMDGVAQIQVNEKAGMTFAAALRSILRADPDVILVGEIRDRETARIGIEAALTGHLVLSTLHTNSAAETPLRLVEMGVEPFLVTTALDCVLAQRLARRVCRNCAEPWHPSDAELDALGWSPEELADAGDGQLLRAVGCRACSDTGYRGRLALHEVLLVTEDIERLIINQAPSEEVKRVAIEQGMLPLRVDGLRKALMGLTTLDEVVRVVA